MEVGVNGLLQKDHALKPVVLEKSFGLVHVRIRNQSTSVLMIVWVPLRTTLFATAYQLAFKMGIFPPGVTLAVVHRRVGEGGKSKSELVILHLLLGANIVKVNQFVLWSVMLDLAR